MSKQAMIFRRKNDRSTGVESTARMRGRDSADKTRGTASGSAQNPLAKRFQAEDEPDTIDLDQPASFHEAAENEPDEVATRILAGAGVEEHLHFHIVPRWFGDVNALTVFADVRVIPEHIKTTYTNLKPHFDELDNNIISESD